MFAEQRLHGAYCQLSDLISARFTAKDLKLQQRRRALSLLAGPNKTSFRGRGLDFEEVRAYQPGDDIRTIDWRVTARTGGKAYTKLFQEERERPVIVVCDQRQPMFFGSQHCFKSVMAAQLAALIAWSGLQNTDRVGGMVIGNDDQREIRPKRSRQTVLSLLQAITEYNQRLNRDSGLQLDSAQRLQESLLELRRIARPGSAIYLLSDFAGLDNSDALKHVHLLARHCEVTALHISDPLEQQLPPPGSYTISDGKQRRMIDTHAKTLRQQYQQHFSNNLNQLHNTLGAAGIPLIEFNTAHAPLARLLQFYGTGKRRASHV